MVTAADAPSIYDIPKVLHREGLDAYVVRRLDLPFRDVDWTVWDDLLRRVHHPKEEVTVALVGKYIDLPDAYLSVAEALRAGGFAHEAKVQHPLDRLRRVRDPGRRRQAPRSDVDAICVPGGFGIRGIEGKLGALTYARTHGIPTLGPLPGPAVHGHRVRPQRRRPREGRLHRVRPGLPRAGDRHHGGAAVASSRAPATSAAPCGSGSTRRSSPRARGRARRTARRRSRSGTGTATRSTTPTATSSRKPGWSSPAPRRTTAWSSSSSCRARCTPTTSPPRPTPSCAPARPGRTRCSRAWSAPPSSARRSCGSRSTSPGCAARSRTSERPRAMPTLSWPTRRVLAGRVAHRPAPRRLGGGAARGPDPTPRAPRRGAVPPAGARAPGRRDGAGARRRRSGCCACGSTATRCGGGWSSCPAGLCDVPGEDPLDGGPARAARGGRPGGRRSGRT